MILTVVKWYCCQLCVSNLGFRNIIKLFTYCLLFLISISPIIINLSSDSFGRVSDE